MKTSTLTEKEVDELMKDWFVRDGETFTPHIKSDFHYEDDVRDYSELITMHRPSFTEVTRYAYRLASNVLIGMDLPTRVNVMLHPKQSKTDGRCVWVSTEMFDDKTLTQPQQLDIFIGLTVHEGAHVMYTDFKTLRPKKLLQTIVNIYEDERIEMNIAEDRPGLVSFLKKTKYYYFDSEYLKALKEKPLPKKITPDNALAMALDTLLRIIRYPKYLRKSDFEYFGKHLQQIKEVLTPYPTSTKEVVVASEKTIEILAEFIKEECDLPEIDMDALAEKIRDFLDTIKIIASGESDEGDIDVSARMTKRISEIAAGICEPGTGNSFFTKTFGGDHCTYNEILTKVRPCLPAMRKAIQYHDKDYKIVHKGMRNGLLDTNKLVDAYQGVPTIYETHGRVKTDKVAICLLIDKSGSMSGENIRAARECAVLLSETFKQNHSIDLFIYGHTADIEGVGDTEMSTYYEPGHKPKYNLANCYAQSQNRDGDAILAAAKRIRKFTDRRCLMFVLSDGEPCAHSYHGQAAIFDTKQKVLQVEKMGIDVCQVAINHSYDPAEMFRNFVILDDLNTLPLKLGKMIKELILKKQKISYT